MLLYYQIFHFSKHIEEKRQIAEVENRLKYAVKRKEEVPDSSSDEDGIVPPPKVKPYNNV